MQVFGIISTNWWYAVTCAHLIQKSTKISKVVFLTDTELTPAIEYILNEFKISVPVTYTNHATEFVEFLNKEKSICLILDHPYRSLEKECIRKIDKSFRIIKMEHGLSIPKGLNRVKKRISNYLRKLYFNTYTSGHFVHSISNPRASGLLYLNWIVEK